MDLNPDHYDGDPPELHPDDGSGVSGSRVPVDHDAELRTVSTSPDLRRLHRRKSRRRPSDQARTPMIDRHHPDLPRSARYADLPLSARRQAPTAFNSCGSLSDDIGWLVLPNVRFCHLLCAADRVDWRSRQH
jgi:hypothetical protein